jgi:hypothetical protein
VVAVLKAIEPTGKVPGGELHHRRVVAPGHGKVPRVDLNTVGGQGDGVGCT